MAFPAAITGAVVVAHGSPSDPAPLERDIAGLAANVSASLPGADPGIRVVGATLASEGSLARAFSALAGCQEILVYPVFMSSGWFVESELPRRVRGATDQTVRYLQPFGLDPRVADLCLERATAAAAALCSGGGTAVLVLAAHGSGRSRAPAEAARAIERHLASSGRFAEVRLGFVEEAPSIAEAASELGGRPAVCLPLFATVAGHVLSDVPEELEQAGFRGTVLPPIGTDEAVPHLIARRIHEASRGR